MKLNKGISIRVDRITAGDELLDFIIEEILKAANEANGKGTDVDDRCNALIQAAEFEIDENIHLDINIDFDFSVYVEDGYTYINEMSINSHEIFIVDGVGINQDVEEVLLKFKSDRFRDYLSGEFWDEWLEEKMENYKLNN